MIEYILANPFAFAVGCLEWCAAYWSWFRVDNKPMGFLWLMYGVTCFTLCYMDYLKVKS